MSPGWAAVVGVSLALMAVVQLAVLIGAFIAWKRTNAQLEALQQGLRSVIDDIRPELLSALEEARAASASMHALASDVRARLDKVDEATHHVRERVGRVADTLQWAVANLPVPMKVSGPAAMATWAGVRVARNLIDRARARRIARRRVVTPTRADDEPRVPTDYPPL